MHSRTSASNLLSGAAAAVPLALIRFTTENQLRFIDDVDVAYAVRYLVSEGARNVTGHEIVVDAGWDV